MELFLDSKIGDFFQSKGYLAAQELDWINYILDGLVYILPINIFYFLTAFAYRLPIDRQKLFEKQALLQKQNLEAKLDFLKAQVHPHTLFNAMNSIYHLIDQRPDAAKEMVLNLSQAMRYHLYESKEDFTPLAKELDYLRNYIAIYKVRKEEDARIDINIEEYSEHAKIAPLVLTPFIENAFKFVSQDPNPEKNWIDISIKVENGFLYFECINTKAEAGQIISKIDGLGIPNVKSRLDLLYGDLYRLDLDDSGTLFTVNLRLPLKGINE
jgi:LytS/YehU family sensor histidine kinase